MMILMTGMSKVTVLDSQTSHHDFQIPLFRCNSFSNFITMMMQFLFIGRICTILGNIDCVMCKTISWCKFSFSAFISKILQTCLPVLSPQRSCQELNMELKWRLMYIENFHYHAKPIISFYPLTTASLWYSDQKSTQSTRKQVTKIITFVKQHQFKKASSSSLVVLSAVPLSALCNFPFSRTIIGCMRGVRGGRSSNCFKHPPFSTLIRQLSQDPIPCNELC